MIGETPLDKKIHHKWAARIWIQRHPYYNYRQTPGADAEEYVRRQDKLRGIDFSYLFN